jgi:beta-glucan synthesis-associated protein KRE6
MYIIMNVAVSHTWGFPQKSDDCACKTYDCDNPACKCALPYGYCDNFPASFEIDYVRVWQAKNESKHYLGCSPDHRPTEKFIQGNAQHFVSEGQKIPLQPVKNGGGVCSRDSDCGSKLTMGVCSSAGKCVCSANHTGPSCKSPSGYYDFDTSDKSIPLLCKFRIICFCVFHGISVLNRFVCDLDNSYH